MNTVGADMSVGIPSYWHWVKESRGNARGKYAEGNAASLDDPRRGYLLTIDSFPRNWANWLAILIR